MSPERFDKMLDGALLPDPDPCRGYDLREVSRRDAFVSRGSAGAWAAWCWSASKPAAEVRRILASETQDTARLGILLDRLEDAWRLGIAARRPQDPDMEYRAVLNLLRLADAIGATREALGMEAVCDVPVEGSWLIAAG